MATTPVFPSKPLVGVTTMRGLHTAGDWAFHVDSVDVNYVETLKRAGALPVLLPEQDDVERLLERLDAVVITGGFDVDPANYGAERHVATDPPDPGRDRFELDIARAAIESSTPLLCICRGIQVLNVARGGTLHQHLPELLGTTVHEGSPGVFTHHKIRTEPGTIVRSVFGESDDVAAFHHQAIDRLGAELAATAWSEDGTIEAVELLGNNDVLAVQWHPEQGGDVRPFRWLVDRTTATS